AAIEHGSEPGTYVVTLQLRVENDEQRAIVAHRRSVVRVGTNVRADLRECLQKGPRTMTMKSFGRRIKGYGMPCPEIDRLVSARPGRARNDRRPRGGAGAAAEAEPQPTAR